MTGTIKIAVMNCNSEMGVIRRRYRNAIQCLCSFGVEQVRGVHLQLISLMGLQQIQMQLDSLTRAEVQNGSAGSQGYKVMRTIDERFQIMNIQLDEGIFQSLFVCWDDHLKEVLTAKIISKTAILEESKQSAHKERMRELHAYALRNQISILQRLHHENIPKLISCSQTAQNLYLFFEYCPRGSLHSIVNKQGPISYEQAMPLWRQLLRVTCYLHSSGIIHRDIRPKNIYVNEKGQLKLINFKSAYNQEQFSPLQESLLERTSFMPPEAFAGQRVSAKMDVWSLGVTLFYMLYGRSPWPQLREGDWHRRLPSSIIFSQEVEIPAMLKLCLVKMLAYDPEIRVSAKEMAHLFGA